MSNEKMYRRTKQKLFLAEKFLERYDEEFVLKFLQCCLECVFYGLESDPPKALKKVLGALLLELSCAPFKPLKEVRPEIKSNDDFSLKNEIIYLMRELSEESESNAELFYYYLRNAEKSQKKKQETKQDSLNLENVYHLNCKGKSRDE